MLSAIREGRHVVIIRNGKMLLTIRNVSDLVVQNIRDSMERANMDSHPDATWSITSKYVVNKHPADEDMVMPPPEYKVSV